MSAGRMIVVAMGLALFVQGFLTWTWWAIVLGLLVVMMAVEKT